MLVEDRERQVTEQRRENPALGRAGDRVPLDAIPREDAGLEERLQQDQDPLVCDSGPQPVKDADMRDFIEARLDVALHDPLIGAGREDVNLGDRVMDPASGAEAVAARLEVRLQDRLEHRLEGGLHHPVAYGRDAQPAIFAAALGDHHLPYRFRAEPAGLEIVSQLRQEAVLAHDGRDVTGGAPIHPAERAPRLLLTRAQASTRTAGSYTRLYRSSNRRSESSVAH
jgi:hypothetical protein